MCAAIPTVGHVEVDPKAYPPKEGSESIVVELVQKTLDSNGKPIWTQQNFDWGWKTNPFATVFSQRNDYVTEQWSEESVLAFKNGVGLAREAIKNVGVSLWDGHGVDAMKHFANTLAIALKLIVSLN